MTAHESGVNVGVLPERRKLPERKGSTYFRALGWNECLDEITRRNDGVVQADRPLRCGYCAGTGTLREGDPYGVVAPEGGQDAA